MTVDEEPRDDAGFSLVELMVVVLIVAILIAIAIPTFLGARQTANDRAVQSNVRNAFTATRVYYNENLAYSGDPAVMRGVEPSLSWTASSLDDSTPSHAVQLLVFDTPDPAQTVVVVGRTRSGRCFYLRDVMGGTGAGTYYQRDVSGAVSCPVIDPTLITGESWS